MSKISIDIPETIKIFHISGNHKVEAFSIDNPTHQRYILDQVRKKIISNVKVSTFTLDSVLSIIKEALNAGWNACENDWHDWENETANDLFQEFVRNINEKD